MQAENRDLEVKYIFHVIVIVLDVTFSKYIYEYIVSCVYRIFI
jgi:hypothetical protein